MLLISRKFNTIDILLGNIFNFLENERKVLLYDFFFFTVFIKNMTKVDNLSVPLCREKFKGLNGHWNWPYPNQESLTNVAHICVGLNGLSAEIFLIYLNFRLTSISTLWKLRIISPSLRHMRYKVAIEISST